MRNRSQRPVAAVIVEVLVLCLAVLLPGESVKAGVQEQPDSFQEASVKVRLQTSKTTFQVGEEIPLELEFRGKAGPDFYFSRIRSLCLTDQCRKMAEARAR
jgi:hypothetical protein